ncbi:DUF2860 family protein [Desulfonatronum sp. SC1]|uniref:DUF2860 family protein n=1 Tax=Desulfonatronum sp. SC1 TaxID=2109626 RepID=UPI000D2FAB1C|nr:DUF2860 family protein [Desulfonatronum sp. SC1]PTN37738.1 hypothetical protein C6366_05725 [Desulfonatronum sp. SC1]
MMKKSRKCMIITSVLLIILLTGGPLLADSTRPQDVPPRPSEIIRPELDKMVMDQEDETGWHANVLLGGGVISGRPSGLDYDKKNKKLKSLDDKADRKTEPIPLIMGSLGYTFGTGTTIRTDLGILDGLALYIDQSLGDIGSMTLGIDTSRYDVWKDPYLIGVERERTRLTQTKFVAEYSIAGLSVGGGVTSQKVKDDDVGKRVDELKRDGNIYDVNVGYAIATEDFGILQPSLSYKRQDLDGKADSSHGYSANIVHNYMIGQITFTTGFSYGKTQYKDINTLVNVKRKDTVYGISETITYNNLFGNPRLYAMMMLAWETTDSNHNIFESNFLTSGLGFGYNF